MSGGGWSYRPHAAQLRADAREPRPKPGRSAQNPRLRDFLQDHMTRRWSPEQICHAPRTRLPDQPEMHVVDETIYQALYDRGCGELRREPTRALRTGRATELKSHPRRTLDWETRAERPSKLLAA